MSIHSAAWYLGRQPQPLLVTSQPGQLSTTKHRSSDSSTSSRDASTAGSAQTPCESSTRTIVETTQDGRDKMASGICFHAQTTAAIASFFIMSHNFSLVCVCRFQINSSSSSSSRLPNIEPFLSSYPCSSFLEVKNSSSALELPTYAHGRMSRSVIQLFKGEVLSGMHNSVITFVRVRAILHKNVVSVPAVPLFPSLPLSHNPAPLSLPLSLLSLSTVSLHHRPDISMGGPTAPLARTPSSMS